MSDDLCLMFEQYFEFDIQVLQQDCGIKIEFMYVFVQVFVDGQIICGINELLVVVVCDIVYVLIQLEQGGFDFDDIVGLIYVVFEILCNVCIFKLQIDLNLVVCWGGYLILCDEYEYIKQVGYQFGLCGMDICIGCGLGVMKGLMKGVIIVYVKQC